MCFLQLFFGSQTRYNMRADVHNCCSVLSQLGYSLSEIAKATRKNVSTVWYNLQKKGAGPAPEENRRSCDEEEANQEVVNID